MRNEDCNISSHFGFLLPDLNNLAACSSTDSARCCEPPISDLTCCGSLHIEQKNPFIQNVHKYMFNLVKLSPSTNWHFFQNNFWSNLIGNTIKTLPEKNLTSPIVYILIHRISDPHIRPGMIAQVTLHEAELNVSLILLTYPFSSGLRVCLHR